MDIAILPPDWEAREGRVAPGDLSQFASEGFALGPPPIIRPWDTLQSLERTQGFYGTDPRSSDPIRSAPSELPSGGTLYFDHRVVDDLPRLIRAVGIHRDLTTYAAFLTRSEDTVRDRYLVQMRLVSHAALSQLFRVSGGAISALPAQKLGLSDAIMAFVADQRATWDDGYAYPRSLRGTLGGDGDWAKEALAFGLFVENGNWQVIRVWSRPWLVTK